MTYCALRFLRGKLARFRVTFSGRLILIKPPFCDNHERQTALSVRFRSIGCHSSDWRRVSRWRYHALLEAAVRELVLHYTNSSRLRALVRILSGLGPGYRRSTGPRRVAIWWSTQARWAVFRRPAAGVRTPRHLFYVRGRCGCRTWRYATPASRTGCRR
jgi:hypothetical protein